MAVRIAAACPACGAPVAFDASDSAARCDRCGGAHLVLRGAGVTVVELASRTSSEEAAALARAALADEMRRLSRAGPEPVAGEPLPFAAPVRVLVARLHEAAVVRSASGDPTTEVTARLVETARTALRETLGLPTAPPLADVDRDALSAVARSSVVAPPFDADDHAYAADAGRLEAVRSGGRPALLRRAVAVPLARILLLRPCRLVPVASGGTNAEVLVDDAARQAVAFLSPSAALALRAEVCRRPLPPSARPELRPMRCPECASPFPLDRQGQLRLCPACRRAYFVSGRRLNRVPYLAELPPSPRGRLLAPAWRFAFALRDPRDGCELTTPAAVRERCGEETGAEGPADLDVPAFLPADRRREQRGVQVLPHLGPSSHPLCEGPARGESGFPEPRLAGALGPAEAAAIVRHALLATLRPETVARASTRRLKSLLFEAPLRTGPPRLVLRALHRDEAEPA